MNDKNKQHEVMEKIADIASESGLSSIEVVGILSILQTTYVLAVASNK